jgi:spore coat protein A
MASPLQVRSGVKLTCYVDPLSIPQVIHATGQPDEVIAIEMRQFQQKVHRDLPPTTLWGYNGSWPGPTIEVQSGHRLNVNWSSKLPTTHLLPIDHSIHGAESSLPAVRNVAHLHGACVLPDDDGYPEAWFTADSEHGPKFNPHPSSYPNCQPTTALWYHDHCLGITRLNVYAVWPASISFATKQRRRSIFHEASSRFRSCCRIASSTKTALSTIPRLSTAPKSTLSGFRSSTGT